MALSPSPSASSLRGSFDDVYRANGAGLLSSVSSSSRRLTSDDDDANMSNDDDAMSSTSSIELEERDSAAINITLENETMELLLEDTSAKIATSSSTANTSQSLSISSLSIVDAARRSASFHSTVGSTASPVVSPKKRKRRVMWLHSHFAPAMQKSVQRMAPHPELMAAIDERDDLMDGDSVRSGRDTFPKVPWADGESHYDDRDGVRLLAVKNQVVATQLRVLSNDPFQVTTDRTNWFLPQGHTPRCRVQVQTMHLPQSIQAEVFLVGYVDDENDDSWMETLEKRTSSTTSGLEHVLYIRIRVGSLTPEGSYEIPVQLFTQHAGFTDEELSWSTVIYIRVANVTLPPPREWKFHLDLWQHCSSIARGHGGVPLWSDAHFQLIDRYFRLLSELGQKCVTIVATEMPWAGQHCYTEMDYPSALYEHAVLDVYEDGKDNSLSIDFQYFDRLVALAETHSMAAEIEVFGILSIWKDPAHGFDTPVAAATATTDGDHTQARPLDSWRIRCVHRTTQRVRYLRETAEIERFITFFYDHCVARGLVDRVRICADEPRDLPAFYAQMAFLERLAPRFKVKVALNHLDFLQFAPPQVVDFVPLLPLVCADVAVTQRWTQQIHEAKHGRFCWYVCCEPSYPNEFVSSPLVEGELVGFLTYFLGLDGFLRWNYCLWPAQPWVNLKWRSSSWRVGDMYFVLPGLDGHPVVTLRFEALRHAVQSYELLTLAEKELPGAAFARIKGEVATLIWRSPAQAEFGKDYVRAGRHPGDLYSLDPRDYEQATRLVIDALALAAMGQDGGEEGRGEEGGDESGPISPRYLPSSPRKRSFHSKEK